ncbi:MAG: YigZ family protein [Turicibacter sp.]|nr:YigZ family protein [Turicibacter sp.]
MPLILSKVGEFELIEKKSRFLGSCSSAQSSEEALAFIQAIKAAHKEANHNVFAYSIAESNVIRFNDDGEPKGTAGMPVLNVFEKSGIINYVCVVTRYFGGTLLGAGGLVRAYTKAAKGALESANPQELLIYSTYIVTCSYANLDRVKYALDKFGAEVLEWRYTEVCQATVQSLSTSNLSGSDINQLATIDMF